MTHEELRNALVIEAAAKVLGLGRDTPNYGKRMDRLEVGYNKWVEYHRIKRCHKSAGAGIE